MAKPTLIEQLDDGVEALMAETDGAPPPAADARLEALLRLAGDLRALPREDFRARLKADLQRAASGPHKVAAVPTGFHTATPYLIVRDAARAIEFYKRAFGASELTEPMRDPSGKIMHADIRIGDSPIMLADESPEYGNLGPLSLGGSPVIIALHVDDVDALAERAVAAGARVLIPVADQFYGHRSGRLADPFGHIWIVSMQIEDVSPDELRRRTAAFTTPPPDTETPAARAPRSITPYLQVDGAERLIAFVRAAFGAEEVLRIPAPYGIAHAEVRIGDASVELADATAEFPPMPTAIHLYVEDADAVYRQALRAGATSLYEPVDQDYGDREASVRDPFGNNWYIGTHQSGGEEARPAGHIPAGLRTITPYLHPHGAARLIDFLRSAFDAQEAFRLDAPDGGVVHAKIRIGDSVVEMGEAHGPFQPMPAALHLYVSDADAVYRRALAAGARSLFEPRDEDYGDRVGGITDPFDNVWYIAHKK